MAVRPVRCGRFGDSRSQRHPILAILRSAIASALEALIATLEGPPSNSDGRLNMVSNRSAHHTIAGYHYQFDKSILDILRSHPNSPVELEAVEDVDVEGECIQVKYHATQKYTRSKIKKPLVAFLEHYRKTGGAKRYRLYAHFDDTSSFVDIDLSGLKAILGHDRTKLRLSDAKLKAFLTDHFECELADDLDTQQAAVLTELQRILSASSSDCMQYYYNNALCEVFRLARQPTLKGRTTTRTAFVKVIDQKSQVFARWLAELRGQRDYAKVVREGLKATDALRSAKSRFVFLADSLLEQASTGDIAAHCRTLADRFYELGKALHDAKPITVIIERPRDDILSVQRELLRKGICLNTGYEAIEFQPDLFNEPPIINRNASRGGKAGDKVAKASYRIGVIGADTYATHRRQIDPPDSFIICSRNLPTNVQPPDGCQTFMIADVSDLMALSAILAK